MLIRHNDRLLVRHQDRIQPFGAFPRLNRRLKWSTDHLALFRIDQSDLCIVEWYKNSTGADSDRKGAFVEADKGTLFLDEIGDLSFALQTKLLRALQEKVIRPVGGDRDIPVDVRLVCATNKDLRECLKTKEFREDLFYRIATVTLTVPPLRERREDVIPLARYFVQHFSGGARVLTPAAEERLLAYSWPGNVRELRSVIEQSIIFAAADEIQPDELNLPSKSDHIDLSSQLLADVERRHILNVLQNAGGNKTEAARILGLARSTLVLKLQSYGALGPANKG